LSEEAAVVVALGMVKNKVVAVLVDTVHLQANPLAQVALQLSLVPVAYRRTPAAAIHHLAL
jgi:allantoicase